MENEIEEFPPNTIGADLKNNDHDVVEDDDDFFVTLNIIISYIVLTIFVIYILLCFILNIKEVMLLFLLSVSCSTVLDESFGTLC